MTTIKQSIMEGPLDWELIKSFHCNAPDFPLPRTLSVIKDYEKHISNLKKINKTVGQYLKEVFFQNGESYQIEPNLFPYYLENNENYCIKHYLIWFNEKLNISEIICESNECIEKIINEFINQTLNNNLSNNLSNNQNNKYDYVYFENSLNNKSVPEIRHVHLFIKTLKL